MSDIKKYNDSIIEAFLKKDDKTILRFYEEQWIKVRSVISKMGGNEDQAKDIMQEATTALYINIKKNKYKNRSDVSISTYFVQLCKFRWYDLSKSAHFSKSQSINTNEQLMLMNYEEEYTKQIDLIERNNQLHRTIDLLNQKCKSILLDFYWKKMSMAEIAKTYKMTIESAKNAKYRCMNRLKSLFKSKKAIGNERI